MERKVSLPSALDAVSSTSRHESQTTMPSSSSNPFSIDSILSNHIGQQQQKQQQLNLQQQLQQQFQQQQQANNTAEMTRAKLSNSTSEQQQQANSLPVTNPNFLYLLTMMLERQQQVQQHQHNLAQQRQLQQAILEQQQHQQQQLQLRQQVQLQQQQQQQQQRNLANIRMQQHRSHLSNPRLAHSNNTNFAPSPQPIRAARRVSSNTPILPPAPPKTNSHLLGPPTLCNVSSVGEKLDTMKPAHSYIGLIGMCVLSSPEKRMVLSDIYQFILDQYPYYRNRGSGWRNSVRHNLSLNECFQKAGRAANGKGHYWTIHPANMEDFMAGDFRRRRAQRKVRRWNNMDVPSDESEDEDATKPPLPEHFKRSIEMHRRLDVMRYQKQQQQAAAASLSMANAAAASLSMANAAAAAAALAVASQQQQQQQENNKRQLQLQADHRPKSTESDTEVEFQV